ncbi:MAG: hypothetical protein AMJ62_04000 [Myxococcales bacterium SG8_38]|nr:MAG: hypothetical protein AMJ62_04000 [Myxococcales bacterium SG8_38]
MGGRGAHQTRRTPLAREILELFVPTADPAALLVDSAGLGNVEAASWFGGTLLYGPATGGPWSIRVERP